jgi:hypothetical protein
MYSTQCWGEGERLLANPSARQPKAKAKELRTLVDEAGREVRKLIEAARATLKALRQAQRRLHVMEP